MFDLPVYLEQPGEHAEIRERVGVCKVSLDKTNAPLPSQLKGDIQLDDEHMWLADLLDGIDCGMGFAPTVEGGRSCLVLRPPTHIGGGERLA